MPSEANPDIKMLRWYYRGPDRPGTNLSVHPLDETAAPDGFALEYVADLPAAETRDEAITLPTTIVKIARYKATGITSTEALATLVGNPEELPERIETLATFVVPALGYNLLGPWPNRRYVDLAITAVPLNMFAGPELIGIEIISSWSLESVAPSLTFTAQLLHRLRVNDELRNLQLRSLGVI